jgi:formylglycine-generating enzyme required for sulfatase activity
MTSNISLVKIITRLILSSIANIGLVTFTFAESNGMFRNPLGMEFIKIPAGHFIRGSNPEDSAADSDESPHTVHITQDFYLQTTEVTQKQWVDFMKGNPSSFRHCGLDCPVDRIDYRWIPYYLEKLNKLELGISYRLPTEAEWEYAARAGSTTRYHNGNCLTNTSANVSGQHQLADCQTFANSSGPTPVASYPPNAWGLYDMHGNVWELCQDWYAPYPLTQSSDPKGPDEGSYKVLRGGSWRFPVEFARSSNRFKTIQAIGGFRLVQVRTPTTTNTNAINDH